MDKDLISSLKTLAEPFANNYKIEGVSAFDWYEENIFNEERLYEALGKEDARSVLGIWRRFKGICNKLESYNKER